jgi:hypothetical protein
VFEKGCSHDFRQQRSTAEPDCTNACERKAGKFHATHPAQPCPLIVNLLSSNRNKAALLRNAGIMPPGMSSIDSYRSTKKNPAQSSAKIRCSWSPIAGPARGTRSRGWIWGARCNLEALVEMKPIIGYRSSMGFVNWRMTYAYHDGGARKNLFPPMTVT